MTVSDVVSYFKGLSPSVLGLEGESMDDYDVYPMEGLIRVNGAEVAEVSVYSDESGANQILGTYLVTRSGVRKVYRFNPWTKEVEELDLTPKKDTGPAPNTEPGYQTGYDTGYEAGYAAGLAAAQAAQVIQ